MSRRRWAKLRICSPPSHSSGNAFQRVEAGGVGLAQAQGGFARLLQVELAQRRQYRFQSAKGQCHLQWPVLTVALRNIDQNKLVIAPPCQAFRIEDFRVRAHQVEQDRQQAQAFAIDDDPQFQIEPVALRRLFDGGVPVVDGGQVKAEFLVDLQFPTLGTQLRQFVEGKRQPRAVVDHLVQLASAFRQRFALACGDTKAEDS